VRAAKVFISLRTGRRAGFLASRGRCVRGLEEVAFIDLGSGVLRTKPRRN
jgi:hypothetical protein